MNEQVNPLSVSVEAPALTLPVIVGDPVPVSAPAPPSNIIMATSQPLLVGGGFKLPQFGVLPSSGGIQISAPQAKPPILSAQDVLTSRQEQRADLLWGASRTGKGVQAWGGAYWMAKTYGKKFLYLTGEPGAAPESLMIAMRAGMGDMLSVVSKDMMKNLLAILSTVLEAGKWPVYRKLNDGSIMRDFATREANCDPNQYGLIIVEMTSIADALIEWCASPDNKAIIPMTPGADKFWVEDSIDGGDHVKIGGSSPTHVGLACRYIQELVTMSAALPYQKVLWIAREQRVNKGEKTNKQGDQILVQGEPMYGPDLPGKKATERVTSWFGGAYHCDRVPTGAGTEDKRPDALGSGGMMIAGPLSAKTTTVPDYEYRLYIRPHPHPTTGILYDAGNRLPAHINNADETLKKPFIACTEVREGKGFKMTGLNTMWELERTAGAGAVEDLTEDLSEMLKKFGGGSANVGDKATSK